MTITPAEVSELIEIKRGDTQRILYDQLLLGGVPINLSGSTVTLVVYDPVADTASRLSPTVTSAISGSVQYQLTTTEIGVAGTRLMEWEIVANDGKELTVPTTQYVKLNIIQDLG